MPNSSAGRFWITAGVCSVMLVSAGCSEKPKPVAAQPIVQSVDPATLPVYVRGTVAQYARLDRTWDISLVGHGVVVGLGTTGSKEVPAAVEKYLTEYMAKHKIGMRSTNTDDVKPLSILQDPDTAVVLVGAMVPLGAPVGTKFDVDVSAMPQTTTTSLSGGHLLPCEMMLAPAGVAAPLTANVPRIGEAKGGAFLNPFLDPGHAQDVSKFRESRVIGGGVITECVPVRLILREPDWGKASMIQSRINDRFRLFETADQRVPMERVANAVSASTIELRTPRAYQNDYRRFLALVLHMPLDNNPASREMIGREIAQTMELPDARYDDLALVWEAMGKPSLSIVRPMYQSSNPTVAYYAARTGLRMGDASACVVVARHALNINSAFRMAAIVELGGQRDFQAVEALRKLLDDPNDVVRIAAYESLAKLPNAGGIKRIKLADQFDIDIVPSSRPTLVYATQTLEQRIAIFGPQMPVQRPMFYISPDEVVMVDGKSAEGLLTMTRKIPRTGKMSTPVTTKATVEAVVRMLGDQPHTNDDGEMVGLGLRYGQVVSLLQGLCKEGDIEARFVLQSLAQPSKIYGDAVTAGRPDMPQ